MFGTLREAECRAGPRTRSDSESSSGGGGTARARVDARRRSVGRYVARSPVRAARLGVGRVRRLRLAEVRDATVMRARPARASLRLKGPLVGPGS